MLRLICDRFRRHYRNSEIGRCLWSNSNQKTEFFTLSVALVWWSRLPLTNTYLRAERCYKHPRDMVLERPERLSLVVWFFFSFSPSFLTWQLYLYLTNFSLFSFGNSIADSLIHSWSRAPFSPFQQCCCLANYFIVLMHLFLSPLTSSYLTTVSTFSLVCPFQNGELITRSASIRKVNVECKSAPRSLLAPYRKNLSHFLKLNPLLMALLISC